MEWDMGETFTEKFSGSANKGGLEALIAGIRDARGGRPGLFSKPFVAFR